MESPAAFPLPVRAAAPRGAVENGQKNVSERESGSSGPRRASEFDQVWNQTVGTPPPSPASPDPGPQESLPSEVPVETVAPPFAGVLPADPELRPFVGAPVPSGGTGLSMPDSLDPPLERTSVQSETGPDLLPDPLESQANPSLAVIPGAFNRTQAADPKAGIPAGTGNEFLPTGAAAQRPGQRDHAPLPPASSAPLQPSGAPVKPYPTMPPGSDAARIAAPGLPGSAAPVLSTESLKPEGNFLSNDNQTLIDSEKRTGIRAALPGISMRRSTDEASPPTTPSPLGLRTSANPLGGLVAPLQVGARPGTRMGAETDPIRSESTINERIATSSSISEGATVSSSSTPSGSSSVSLAGLRQTEAASVLEMVNRMADQMAVRNQDRLSMTVRFEDGGSIRIRMTNDQGEIRTHFQTDLPGLEAALRQQWSQFSQDAQDRGMRFQSMAFSSADTNADQRDRQPETPSQQEPFFAPDRSVATPTGSGPADQSTKTDRPETATETRVPGHLRAWV